MINNFDAAARLLNIGDAKVMKQYPTYKHKMDLFFIDHEFVPLLVHENFLLAMEKRLQARGMVNQVVTNELEKMALATDALSTSDILNKKIRQE